MVGTRWPRQQERKLRFNHSKLGFRLRNSQTGTQRWNPFRSSIDDEKRNSENDMAALAQSRRG
jgi:hypothetical protein